VQGPFGGSKIADYFLGYGTAPDSRLPILNRFYLTTLAGILKNDIKREVLHSLSSHFLQFFWKDKLTRFGKNVPLVQDKLWYITSKEHPAYMGPLLFYSGSYLKTYYGPNDGLVLTQDQLVEGVGNLLFTATADHFDLVQPWPLSNASKNVRNALMRSIVEHCAD
jgi:hypothetical protein